MTTSAGSSVSAVPPHGHLLAVEEIPPGSWVYLPPLRRSISQWCHVSANTHLPRSGSWRLSLTAPDGTVFSHRTQPGHVLRAADSAPPICRREVDVARDVLRRLAPSTRFEVRPRGGEVWITWTDGPGRLTVVPPLVKAGVVRPRCQWKLSPLAMAAVVVRVARERDLTRLQGIDLGPVENALERLTEDEWYLARHLLAICDEAPPGYVSLLRTMQLWGLDNLADLAEIPVPAPIDSCVKCPAAAEFVATRLAEGWQWRLCGSCLAGYRNGGFEMVPLAV